MIIVTDRREEEPSQHQHGEPAQQVDEPIERPPLEQGGVVEGCGHG